MLNRMTCARMIFKDSKKKKLRLSLNIDSTTYHNFNYLLYYIRGIPYSLIIQYNVTIISVNFHDHYHRIIYRKSIELDLIKYVNLSITHI
jgi:hypothetical protein